MWITDWTEHAACKGTLRRDQGALLSTRSLVILAVSGCIGLLAGVSAGAATAIQTAPSIGLGPAIVLGLVSGVVAMAIVGGTIAATLHSLVGHSG